MTLRFRQLINGGKRNVSAGRGVQFPTSRPYPLPGSATGSSHFPPLGRALPALAFALAACQHTPEARVETVEVKVPVAVQPITKDQVPPLPGQLGPRPDNARDAADVALAGRCEALAFVIRAYPLLLLSAGLPPAQAPDYPECDKK